MPVDPLTVWDTACWAAAQAAHEARVHKLIHPHLRRKQRGESHPVEDFLFTYYSYRPSQLRRWHPGPGVMLAGDPPHRQWRGYVAYDQGVALDPDHVRNRGTTVRWIRDLLTATAARPAFTGCLGLHEWAMVYRQRPDGIRHGSWPLRLGPAGTDAVVESRQIRCSHHDAFRFFATEARTRNVLTPTRERQLELEQPGCLHTNMDLYKWAYKLAPMVPSELVVDAFVLAREIRELDMRASPYDLTMLGYEPVRIETDQGRRAYITAQRAFAERADALRQRLLEAIDVLDPQ